MERHVPRYQTTENFIFGILGDVEDNQPLHEGRISKRNSNIIEETEENVEESSEIKNRMENDEFLKKESSRSKNNEEYTSSDIRSQCGNSTREEKNVKETQNTLVFPLAKKDLVFWVGGQMDAVTTALQVPYLLPGKWQLLIQLRNTLQSILDAVENSTPNSQCPQKDICKLPMKSPNESLFNNLFRRCLKFFRRSASRKERQDAMLGEDVVDKLEDLNCPIQNMINSLQNLLSFEPDFSSDQINWKVFCVPLLVGTAATLYYIGKTNLAESVYHTVEQVRKASEEFDVNLWIHVIIPTVLTAIEVLTQQQLPQDKHNLFQPLIWHWLQYLLGQTAVVLFQTLENIMYFLLLTKEKIL